MLREGRKSNPTHEGVATHVALHICKDIALDDVTAMLRTEMTSLMTRYGPEQTPVMAEGVDGITVVARKIKIIMIKFRKWDTEISIEG